MNPKDLTQMVGDVMEWMKPKLAAKEAQWLLLGTAAVESSGGRYLYQIKGPARGIFQMEPRTGWDIWENYLVHRTSYEADLMRTTGLSYDIAFDSIDQVEYLLTTNLAWGPELSNIET